MATYNPLDADGDPFRPPALSTLVHCLHCDEEYDSYRIEWRVETGRDGQARGFWCCPIAGCGGRGFGFDIFPVDPDYRDEEGNKLWCSDDDEEEQDELDGGDVDAGDPDAGDPDDGDEQREAIPWED